MCLLLTQPEGHSFSNEWLADFYANNADGIGVMYAENGKLHIEKLVPKSFKQLKKFYHQHIAGKACATHFRMRTHGDINLDNCHPYQVFSEADGYPLWLMHNGVLSTGNAKDTSKSDTYHYINDIIRPALHGRPEQFMSKWFQDLIEDHIGSSNKFVMMDAHGNTMTFNKDSGVMWGDVWMSNTYAWSAAKAGVIKPSYYGSSYNKYNGYGGGYGWGGWDDDYYEPVGKKTPAVNTLRAYDDDSIEMQYAELFMDTLSKRRFYESYSTLTHEELATYYREDPYEAEDLLLALEDGEISDVQILELFDGIAYGNYMNTDAVNDKVAA